MYMITGLFYGHPRHVGGVIYLMMYPYHWLFTSRTPYAKDIKVGNIVLVHSLNKNEGVPVYVLVKHNEQQTQIIGKKLMNNHHIIKTVTQGKLTHSMQYHSYLTKCPPHDVKTKKQLTFLIDKYHQMQSQGRTSDKTNKLSRMILKKHGRYVYQPCDKKYAWWLRD